MNADGAELTNELQIHLVEYDLLQREHDLHLKIRQELGIYTLIATITLIGAFVTQMAVIKDPSFVRIFLILPMFFTFMTWWYVRTNYSAALIDEYILTKLRPRLMSLAKNEVAGWVPFLYTNEFLSEGWFIVSFQTMSRLLIIQGPAVLSLIIFGVQASDQHLWNPLNLALLVMNLLGLLFSVFLIILTWRLISRIRTGLLKQQGCNVSKDVE